MASTSKPTRRPRKRAAAPKRPAAPKLPADVQKAIRAAQDKKAADLLVLDLRQASAFTDCFLLCTGANTKQVQAIADGIEESLRASGVRPSLVEGYDRAEWILIDYFDFIVHIFSPVTRDFYGLERLWGDAVQIAVPAN